MDGGLQLRTPALPAGLPLTPGSTLHHSNQPSVRSNGGNSKPFDQCCMILAWLGRPSQDLYGEIRTKVSVRTRPQRSHRLCRSTRRSRLEALVDLRAIHQRPRSTSRTQVPEREFELLDKEGAPPPMTMAKWQSAPGRSIVPTLVKSSEKIFGAPEPHRRS
jgi:hypothetical protein